MARLDDNPRDAQNAKKREKALRGFEPRLLDSESRVLAVTPQGHLLVTQCRMLKLVKMPHADVDEKTPP